MRPDGTGDELLVHVPLPAQSSLSYSVSPTGNELLYTLYERTEQGIQAHWFLYRDGQSMAVTIPYLYHPRWTPDGSRLIGGVIRERPVRNQLYAFHLATLTSEMVPVPSNAVFCPDMTCLVVAETRPNRGAGCGKCRPASGESAPPR